MQSYAATRFPKISQSSASLPSASDASLRNLLVSYSAFLFLPRWGGLACYVWDVSGV